MCPLANVPCVMEVSPTQGKEKKAHTKSPNPGVFLGFLKEIILLVGVFFWCQAKWDFSIVTLQVSLKVTLWVDCFKLEQDPKT